LKETIKVVKQGLLIAFMIIFAAIITGPILYGCQCNCKNNKFVKVGEVEVYKNIYNYKVIFKSELTQVVTKAESEGSFNLSLIKSVVDAGLDKVYPKLYVERSCYERLRKAYGKIGMDTETSKYVFTQPILSCWIYGKHIFAVKAYDKDLYDTLMFNYVDKWQTELPPGNPRELIPLINDRGPNEYRSKVHF